MRTEPSLSAVQRLWIPGAPPSFNEIIAACIASHRLTPSGKRYNAYNATKQQWTERVGMMARVQKLRPVEAGYFTYLFREENQRRDPSNFVAGGVKMIEDGLKACGVIRNDGWAVVLGYTSYWMVDNRAPGVSVFISQRMVLDRSDAMWRDQEARKRDGQQRQ